MISLSRISEVLKNVYFSGTISQTLNCETDVFFVMIEHTTKDVYGNEIIVYKQKPDGDFFVLKSSMNTLKAGIEISDKEVRNANEIIIADKVHDMLGKATPIIKSEVYKSLEELFADKDTIYGVNRSEDHRLHLKIKNISTINNYNIREIIDNYELETNLIIMSNKIFREYKDYLEANYRTYEVVSLQGGFKGIKFDDAVIVGEKMLDDNCIYLLNTKDFKYHQLCDWEWIEDENGKILKQCPNLPKYTGSLVKFGKIMCHNPSGQVKLILEDKNGNL